MAGINSVTIVGNLGRDPEIRSFPNGDRVANLSLATSETWRDKSSGERKERTEWHRVTVLNDNLIKVIESYVKKGSTIGIVNGSLQTRKWTDKDGVEKFSTEIVVGKFKGELTLLGGKPDGERQGGGGGDDYSSGFSTGGGKAGPRETYDLNDDIPFCFQAGAFDVQP